MYSMIDFVFDCINFLIVIFVIWYVLKTYVLCMLKDMRFKERDELQMLIDQQFKGIDRCAMLEQRIAQQEKVYKDLQQKFLIWQAAFDQKKSDRMKKCEYMQQRLDDFLVQKQEHRAQMRLQKKEIPRILEKTEHSLRQRFAHKKNIDAYNKKIFAFMKDAL